MNVSAPLLPPLRISSHLGQERCKAPPPRAPLPRPPPKTLTPPLLKTQARALRALRARVVRPKEIRARARRRRAQERNHKFDLPPGDENLDIGPFHNRNPSLKNGEKLVLLQQEGRGRGRRPCKKKSFQSIGRGYDSPSESHVLARNGKSSTRVHHAPGAEP